MSVDPNHWDIWGCQIGEVRRRWLPNGADSPMRQAVKDAYRALTGKEPDFIFSGWGEELKPGRRACVEDRLPTEAEDRAYIAKLKEEIKVIEDYWDTNGTAPQEAQADPQDHSCHDECACQNGGHPKPDFVAPVPQTEGEVPGP